MAECGATTQGTLKCCPDVPTSDFICQIWFAANGREGTPTTPMVTPEGYFPKGDLFSQIIVVMDAVMQRGLSLLSSLSYGATAGTVAYRLVYPGAVPNTTAIRFDAAGASNLILETSASTPLNSIVEAVVTGPAAKSGWAQGGTIPLHTFGHLMMVQKHKRVVQPASKFCVREYFGCQNPPPSVGSPVEFPSALTIEQYPTAFSISTERSSHCSASTSITKFKLITNGIC